MSPLNVVRPPWSAVLGAVLVAVLTFGGGGLWAGWRARGDHEDAKRLAEVRAVQADLERERQRGDQLATDLEAEKRNIKTVTVEVIKRVPAVTTVYVEKPGDAPVQIPDAVYTRGFVSMWNDAYRGLSTAAGQPDGHAGRADAPIRARIGTADVLANQVENAGKWAECRAQLRALIEFDRGRAGSTAGTTPASTPAAP